MHCINREHPIMGEFYLDDVGNIIQVIPKDPTKKVKEIEGFDVYVKIVNGNSELVSYFVGESSNYFSLEKINFRHFKHLNGYNTKLWKVINDK